VNISSTRLVNQRLTGKKFSGATETVEYFGAIQSQDFPAAKWSLGIRLENAGNIDIEKAYNQGKILRTHIMRPTWHFVAPSDIRWMQKLTSGRVKAVLGHYDRKLELTDRVYAKSNTVIAKALQNHNYLTRQDLKKILEDIGIVTDVQRLAHLLIRAELDGIVTSGPMRGKQFTYALLDERIDKTKVLSREESVSRLIQKYFQSHGPAQLKDFAWWSGLTTKDVNEGINLVGSKLSRFSLNGKTYWFSGDGGIIRNEIQNALLLSVYDEYFIGYTDRSDMLDEPYRKLLPVGNALLTSLLIINGQVGGTWKRKINKNCVQFIISPFKTDNLQEKSAFEAEIRRYADFFGYASTSVIYSE
jgi:hypothetical protein